MHAYHDQFSLTYLIDASTISFYGLLQSALSRSSWKRIWRR